MLEWIYNMELFCSRSWRLGRIIFLSIFYCMQTMIMSAIDMNFVFLLTTSVTMNDEKIVYIAGYTLNDGKIVLEISSLCPL